MRRLPDGSLWDPATGSVVDVNPTHAQMARIAELHRRQRAPIPSRGQQIETVVQARLSDGANQVALQPRTRTLAVDPYGTGMSSESMARNGFMGLGTMSDTHKRILLMGLIVAAAAGSVWLQKKMGGK